MLLRTRRGIFCLALISLGLLISSYLLLRYFTLHSDPTVKGSGFCSAVLKMDCDASLLSDKAKQFGIPVAGWGVVYYLTLTCLLVLGGLLRGFFDGAAMLGAFILGLMGACGSIVLASIILLGRAPFCPLCMATHAINLGLVWALWGLHGLRRDELVQTFKTAVGYLVGKSQVDVARANWVCLGYFTTALVALVFYQYIHLQTELCVDSQTAFDAKQVLIDYIFAPLEDIPVHASDPQLGNGPVELVIFSSFECPGCRVLSEYLHEAVNDRLQDKLRIVYKHFPLGKACNKLLKEEKYPQACVAAWAAEAAHQEHAFWPYHDALLVANLNDVNQPIERVVSQAGLVLSRFDQLRESSQVKDKVKADIDLGIRLGVNGTPTLFVNGRRIKNPTLKAVDLILNTVTTYPQIESTQAKKSRAGPDLMPHNVTEPQSVRSLTPTVVPDLNVSMETFALGDI